MSLPVHKLKFISLREYIMLNSAQHYLLLRMLFSDALHSVFCSFLLEIETEKRTGVLEATEGTYVPTCH